MAVRDEQLQRQDADVLEFLEHAADVFAGLPLERGIDERRARDRQYSVVVPVLGQRPDGDLAALAAHSYHGHLEVERHPRLGDQPASAEFLDRCRAVVDRPQDELPLAVVAESACLEYERESDLRSRTLEVFDAFDGTERRQGDVQRLEQPLFLQAVLSLLEGVQRGEDADIAVELAQRVDRHVLEFIRDDVAVCGNVRKCRRVVERGTDDFADRGRRRILRRIQEQALVAELERRFTEHLAELAGADNADAHGKPLSPADRDSRALCRSEPA